MRRTFFALLVAGVSVAITDARPRAQQNPLGQLIEKAKQKLQKPVECVETDQACIDKARRSGTPVKILPAPPAPTPVAVGAAAPAAVPSGDFAAPAPSHEALFKLFMAAYADVLSTDELAAWEHHIVFRVPPNQRNQFSPECATLMRQVQNEITAESVKAAVIADFKSALVQSSAGAKTARFLIRTWEQFRPFDSARSVFPLESNYGGNTSLGGGARIVVPRTPTSVLSPDELRQQSGLGQPFYCAAVDRNLKHPVIPNQAAIGPATASGNGVVGWFQLVLHGQETLTEFPMERAAAEAFVNANPDRSVALEMLLEVGPVQVPPAGGPLTAPAHVTNARVLDKNTGRVLHTFTGLTTTPTTTTSTVALSTSAALPFSGNRALLLTLRDHPELAIADALLDATRHQVGAEQMTWRAIGLALDPKNGANLRGRYRLNPKRETFFYEWQSLVDRQPELARGPLLDTFMRPDADWSFVTRDPAWDARFTALVTVFLFSRDKIEGREPSFAAQELMPVYKRHLDMAISKAPTQFWFAVPLGFNYDFASKSLRLSGGMARRRAESPDDTDLLGPLPSEPEVALPEGARGRAVYGIGGGAPTKQKGEPVSVPPGVPVGGVSPTDNWRGFAVIGSSWHKIPLPAIVALDHRLKIDSIPMEPARAEQLVKAQTAAPGPSVLSARVYFDAERVDLGSAVYDRQREPAAVLLAKVRRVDIVDAGNQVVATIAGDALPAPVTRTNTPPTVQAPVKTGPTPAEIETERRRKLDEQEAERSRQISERLNQQVQKQVKCATEASKVDGNTASKAYRDAYTACMAK
jgi:hypothetical protein